MWVSLGWHKVADRGYDSRRTSERTRFLAFFYLLRLLVLWLYFLHPLNAWNDKMNPYCTTLTFCLSSLLGPFDYKKPPTNQPTSPKNPQKMHPLNERKSRACYQIDAWLLVLENLEVSFIFPWNRKWRWKRSTGWLKDVWGERERVGWGRLGWQSNMKGRLQRVGMGQVFYWCIIREAQFPFLQQIG